MLGNLIHLAMGTALVIGSLTAQQRSETVPVTTTDPALNGFVADVYGSNFNTFSLVGFVARVDSFNFGSGTIESVDHLDGDPLYYTHSFKFAVEPDWVWGAWCVGLGSCTFTVQY